jgi:hypothetical protein
MYFKHAYMGQLRQCLSTDFKQRTGREANTDLTLIVTLTDGRTDGRTVIRKMVWMWTDTVCSLFSLSSLASSSSLQELEISCFECNFKCYILIIDKMDFKIFKVLKRRKSVC